MHVTNIGLVFIILKNEKNRRKRKAGRVEGRKEGKKERGEREN